MAILQKFKLTIGSEGAAKTYFFLQSPGSYAGTIDTVVGVTEAATNEKDEPVVSVQSLLNSGKAMRVVVSYVTAGRRRSGKLLVARDKLGTALDQLIGKTYRGGNITSARIPGKATFF